MLLALALLYSSASASTSARKKREVMFLIPVYLVKCNYYYCTVLASATSLSARIQFMRFATSSHSISLFRLWQVSKPTIVRPRAVKKDVSLPETVGWNSSQSWAHLPGKLLPQLELARLTQRRGGVILR